jgi:hypothetical protein
MPAVTHVEAGELLAAYALDAVTDDERRQLDAHVATCASCADELARHREAAGLIAQTELPAPSGQWDRIAAAIDERPPVVSLAARRRSRATTVLAAAGAAAVAAAAAAALTFALVDADDSGSGVEAAARAAAADPAAQTVALEDAGGAPVMRAVVLPDGRAYVVDNALAALPEGRTYQLWALGRGDPVSLGLLGRDPGVRELDVPPGTEQLAVTEEDATGAVQPTATPVAMGSIA